MRLEPLVLIAVLVPLAASGEPNTTDRPWSRWEYDYDEGRKSWKEIQAQLPAYPKAENLIAIDAGSATPHRFFIDAASVSIGEDGVVRYTAVTRTGGGATNVTFEGMRCETREGKLYAIGHSDGTWARPRDAQWQRIVLRDLKPYPFVLYREYFCPSPARPTPVRVALEALKRGVGLSTSRASDE